MIVCDTLSRFPILHIVKRAIETDPGNSAASYLATSIDLILILILIHTHDCGHRGVSKHSVVIIQHISGALLLSGIENLRYICNHPYYT